MTMQENTQKKRWTNAFSKWWILTQITNSIFHDDIRYAKLTFYLVVE